MKRGKKKTQMKQGKGKTRSSFYSPENCSDNFVSEIKLQLQKFSRNQLEKVICILSQEIITLEHKLQPCSSCSVNTDGQSEHSDRQAITNGEKTSRHSETKCAVFHRILQSITSVTHFKTKKSGEIIKHQENKKVEQLSTSEDSYDDLNLNNEIVYDEYENSYEHTYTQVPSHQARPIYENIELSPPTRIRHYQKNPMKTQTVSNDACIEDMVFLNGAKFKRKKEKNNVAEIVPNEKVVYSCFQLLNGTCEERKKPLRNEKNEHVSLEHLQQVPVVDDSMESFKHSDSGQHVSCQEGSVQDRSEAVLHRCVNRSVPDERVQQLGESNNYKVSQQPSIQNVLNKSSETSQENEMIFVCCFCKVPFQSKMILTEHMKTEHKCTQYSCLVCGKSFRYKHSLKAHQRGSHIGTTVLCSYCGKLVLQARLDMHMEKVHERPMYTCHICQKGFLKRECLEGHINKHSNTKPYICEHCGRKYAYSTSLSSHKKQCVRASMPPHLQHPRSVDNKCTSCVCEICGLKFEGVSGLKDHLSAKHSNKLQSCSFCGKEFHWRPSYNRHIKKCVDRTDLERERYRWLKSQKTLGKHYVCVCGKQYPYRQSFRRHERSCHQKQQVESAVVNLVSTTASGEVSYSESLSSSLQLPTPLNLQ